MLDQDKPYKPYRDEKDRLMDKVAPEPNTGCWLWTAADDGQNGYGRFGFRGGRTSAHRASYQIFVGPIPDGLVIDHLCRVPACVNPAHMELVTQTENVKRGNYRKGLALGGRASGKAQQAKTHCPAGHAYAEDGYKSEITGWRRCRKCHREKERARRKLRMSNVKGFA